MRLRNTLIASLACALLATATAAHAQTKWR